MKALIYAAGVLTGIALMAYNRHSVQKAVDNERARSEQLRRENQMLREDLASLNRASDCRDAYRRGRQEGREDPVSNAERFARNFEGRKVEFRGGKTA